MIETSSTENATTIVLAPDRSSDWKTNKLIIAILGSVCIGIALGFYIVMGIWMILPFAGLEIIALAAGLYYASWKLNYRHILHFNNGNLIIEKGVYRPKGSWNWPRQDVLLKVKTSKQDWSPPSITLCYEKERVEIGEFLGKSEAEELVQLISQHLQVRHELPQ